MSKSRAVVVCLAVALTATTAFGANPPKRAGGPPPEVWDTSGAPEDALIPANFDGPEQPVDFPYYADVAKRAEKGDTVMRIRSKYRSFVPDATAVPGSPVHLYTAQVSTEGRRNTESSVYTMNKNGVTATNVAYMHFTGTNWVARVARSTNLTQWGGSFSAPAALAIPTGYTDLVDPWLTANPTAAGQRPGALYYTALAGVRSGNSLANPTAIRIYASDDNGATWSVGQDVRTHSASSSYFADKPHADVSLYSGTQGYIYVTWVEYGVSVNGAPAPPTRIMFRRNWGGLWTRCRPYGGICDTSWDPTVVVDSGDPLAIDQGQPRVAMPQVVSNPNNGEVYVLYMSTAATFSEFSRLMMRRSTDNGATWSAPITVVNNIIPTNSNRLLNNVFMLPVPNAKFNHGTNRLVVTWSAQTAFTTGRTNETAVYYASFDPTTISGPVTSRVAANALGRADFQPAFDHDNAGNMLFTYYRTDNSTTADLQYSLYGVSVSAGGTIYTPAPIGPGGLYSTPTTSVAGFLGDYHDTFYYSADGWPRWDTAWTRVDDPFAVLTQMLSGAQ